MKIGWTFSLITLLAACSRFHRITAPQRHSTMTGSAFYKTAAAFQWQQRDSLVLKEVFSGNLPDFLKIFEPVRVQIKHPATGKTIKAVYYVSPDYLCIGTNEDWARVHITPYAAQKITDSFHCFLPTKKMVDDIYRAAVVKLEPVPLFAFRDSTPTMYHHHLIVEGQRKGRKGLIAGIQKDVVISAKISKDGKPGRVAIYGWHQLNGVPIQPLYTGHAYSWVDYSQGIRLVFGQIKVDGRWINYKDVLKDPVLVKLICDEDYCDLYKYPY